MMSRRKKLNGRNLTEPLMTARLGHRPAFSYLELTIVLVIVAIIYLLAKPSPGDVDQVRLIMAAQTIQSDLRYLQQLARATGPNEVFAFIIQPEPPESTDAADPQMWDALASAEGAVNLNNALIILPQSANALTYLASNSIVLTPYGGPDTVRWGACCHIGGCNMGPPEYCTDVSGVYQGDNSICSDSCQIGSIGACCGGTDGYCIEVSQGDCANTTGRFLGVGSTCIVTNGPVDYDPCITCARNTDCDDGDYCNIDRCDGGYCLNIPLISQQLCDDGNPCTADVCVPGSGCEHTATLGCRMGACCKYGACRVLRSEDCDPDYYIYMGDGTTCNPNPCGNLTGACCMPDECLPDYLETDCADQAGTYAGDLTECGSAICPDETPTDPDPYEEFRGSNCLGCSWSNIGRPPRDPLPPDTSAFSWEGIFWGGGEPTDPEIIVGAQYALLRINLATEEVETVLARNLFLEYGVHVLFVCDELSLGKPMVVIPGTPMFAGSMQFTLTTKGEAGLAVAVTRSGQVFAEDHRGKQVPGSYPSITRNRILQRAIVFIRDGGTLDKQALLRRGTHAL